jgi:3-phenylpropionate/trans-cinnamate dioxygenase ferredoxin reductase subunit
MTAREAAPALSADGRVVIVGGGQAGGWAARTLREEGFEGEICLVGDEPHAPYERPPLSKAVLLGEQPPASTLLFPEDTWEALRIDRRLRTRAVRIDRGASTLELEGQAPIVWDRLILCTGGRPRPLTDSLTTAPVHLLRTIEEALAIGARLVEGRTVVVLGAGWIGLEVAAAARKRQCRVIVVEPAARVCARTVPSCVSDFLHQLHAREGVEVKLARTARQINATAACSARVELSDGERIDADLVVAGLGLLANDEMAAEAGLECRQGVVVDHRCATSDPRIFAAGDVAVAPNRWVSGLLRLESWQNAQQQGAAAARAALGQDIRYEPLPWFWSDQFDTNLQIYGVPLPNDRVLALPHEPVDDQCATARVWHFIRGGVPVAAIAANAPRALRAARKLIEAGQPVADDRLPRP